MANANETKPTNAVATKQEKAVAKASKMPWYDYLDSEKNLALSAQLIQTSLFKDKGFVASVMASVLNACRLNEGLRKVNQDSLYNVLKSCCEYGIVPNGRDAYIIPYKDEAQFMLSYMGMVTLLHKSGLVSKIEAHIVKAGDRFSWRNGVVDHCVDWFDSDRGDMIGVYAMCTFKDGTVQYEVMSKKDVEDVRKSSKAPNAMPWKDHYDEMAKKSVVRRICKYLPISQSAALHNVMSYDDGENFDYNNQQPIANIAPRKQNADALYETLAKSSKDTDPTDDADTVTVEAEVVE